MKIAVYTIALNEEKHVKRWYESSKEADYHLILDTGSTDKTVELAKKLGIRVEHASINPWRFDVARNTALALLPGEIDYCIVMDMDEVLVPGWREKLESVDATVVTRPRHTFTFSFNPDGTPAYQFGGNRIHARNGYTWKYPIHEISVPYGIDETQVWTTIEMQHKPDNTKSRGQYLGMLSSAVKEYPNDPRMSFYYGRELFYAGMYKQSMEELARFLALPDATWVGDRSDAYILISKCTPDLTEGAYWASLAIKEAPDRREGYVRLARINYFLGDYNEALKYSEKALKIVERPLQYMCEDWAWNWEPWDIAAISAWAVGETEKAKTYGTTAFEMAPHIERLAENMKYFVG